MNNILLGQTLRNMQVLSPKEFLQKSNTVPVIDVRSPGEYEVGHISGAINIPLFTDDERAVVGTLYKKSGRLFAINKGLEIIGPKMAGLTREALKYSKDGELLVHCWRGGMRSESMAWLFERVDIKCSILLGGYKVYRNHILESFANIPNLCVLEGHTGSGKTEILHELKKLGEQVIDLEGLANHRGSAFGGIGQGSQPTSQQFHNDIFGHLKVMDLTRRIWVEGESHTIGRVFLPETFWESMNNAYVVEMIVPRKFRLERVVVDYGSLDSELMENAIGKIEKRLGSDRKKIVLENYRKGKLALVADMLLDYYDKGYQYSRDKFKRERKKIIVPNGDANSNAQILIEKVNKVE
jgi:tRNA 2-selenouridine synthase